MIDFTIRTSLLQGLRLGVAGEERHIDVRQWGMMTTLSFLWLDNSQWQIEYAAYGQQSQITCSGVEVAKASAAVSTLSTLSYERPWQSAESHGSISWTEHGWWKGLRRFWQLSNADSPSLAEGEFQTGGFKVTACEIYPTLVPAFAAIALSVLQGAPPAR